MACCAFISGMIALLLLAKARLFGHVTTTDQALAWRLNKPVSAGDRDE